MKIIDKKPLTVRTAAIVLLLFACFYMYDFYKSLSGFIANGFREPQVMLPMILAFFLPVLCFLFFFYDFFVRAINPAVKTVYSLFIAAYGIVDLVLIFYNIELYVSNNSLGVYDALPSIIVHFPYDMIAILSLLIAVQVFNIAVGDRRGTKASSFVEDIKLRGTLKISVPEYLALCVLAIIVFVFTGAAITGIFTAFANAFYDARYVFLLLWVLIIPMGNLALMVLKPEKTELSKRAKLSILATGICANLLFALLFWVLELTSPNFLVFIGKPLFLIAFSVSLPIEPAIIFAIMLIGALLMSVRLICTLRAKK